MDIAAAFTLFVVFDNERFMLCALGVRVCMRIRFWGPLFMWRVYAESFDSVAHI